MPKKISLLFFIILLSSCGSTPTPQGEGTPNGPMQIASQINVLTPSNDTNKAARTAEYFLRSFNDAGTDYANDRTDFYVRLEALEPLETANMILCFMSQLGVSDPSTLNSGDYLALVDPSKCEKGKGSSNDRGESGGSDVSGRYRFVVNNTRANGDSPQIVKIWLDMGEGRGGQVRGEMTIAASATVAPPFGLFTFNWVQLTDDPANPRTRGSLVVFNSEPQTGAPLTNGNVGLTLFMQEAPQFGEGKVSHLNPRDVLGDHANFVKAASAVMTTDENGNVVSGRALTQLKAIDTRTGDVIDIDAILTELNAEPGDFDTEQFSRTFAMSYNEDNLLMQTAHLQSQLPFVIDPNDNNSGLCLSRHEYDEAVWCYNLYDAQSGDRVELNSGFSFTVQKEACGTRPMFGHVGYYGLWFEGDHSGQDGCMIENGDIIVKRNRENNALENYEVQRSTGHLMKNTILQLELARLKDQRLEMNQLPNDSKLFQDPNNNDPNPYAALVALKESGNYQVNNWIVKYLTTSMGVEVNGFYIVGFVSNPDGGGQLLTLLSQVEGVEGLEARYDVTPREFDGQQIWMYSAQLGGSVRYTRGQNVVTFTKQEKVDPTDALFLNSNDSAGLLCLWDCLKSNITEENQNAPNGVRLPDESYTVGENQVRYVPYQISRTDMALQNLAGEDIALAEGAQSVGMHQWGIHMGPLVTQSQLASLTNWWEIWNTVGVVFYTWETGSNPWNTSVFVRQAGSSEPVVFDKPIQFPYTHTTQSDRAGSDEHNDETFLLTYQGDCQLHGIPNRKVTRGRDSRYYPEFAIADGSFMGPDDIYVVKGIQGEQNPLPAEGQCTLLSIQEPAVGLPGQVAASPSNITVQMPDISVVTVENGVVVN